MSYLLCEVRFLKFILSYMCLITGVKSHDKEHKSGLHIEKIPFEKTSVNVESWWKSHSPPLLEMPNNPLTCCPVCQAQRKAHSRLVSSCWSADPSARDGAQHRTQMILTQETPDKGPPSSPAPLQTRAECHTPQHQGFNHVSIGTIQREVTSKILQGIDFS